MCENFASPLTPIFEAIVSLGYEEEPKYEEIILLLVRALLDQNLPPQVLNYDWVRDPKLLTSYLKNEKATLTNLSCESMEITVKLWLYKRAGLETSVFFSLPYSLFYSPPTRQKMSATCLKGGEPMHAMQVRNIMGTIVEVGKGKITVDHIDVLFEEKDRKKAGQVASIILHRTCFFFS